MSPRTRAPTLSNAAQVELMTKLKKDRLSVDAAMNLAQTMEEVGIA